MAKLKGKPLVGLDIGSKWIKAVELVPTDEGMALTNYMVEEIQGGTDIKEILKNLFHKSSFQAKKVVTAVSGRSVIVRYITMPEMPDDELKNAIRYEASKYIPFEVEEVVLDCQRLTYETKEEKEEAPKTAAKEMRVLLVAVKKNTIDEQLDILEGAGLWPHIIDVDVFALGNAFELHEMLSTARGEVNQSVALIDIGSVKTSVNIMYNINSYFTREISIAGNDLTEAISKKLGIEPSQAETLKRDPGLKEAELIEVTSGVLDDLYHEIHLSFDYFEHQFEKHIDLIYLSGGTSRLKWLPDSFEKAFEKRPIMWNPLENIAVINENIDQADLNSKLSQLAIATGLASRLKGK
jgi:type IV pilus assembly protein PilM